MFAILLSSGLSGTYQSACLARTMLNDDERIEIRFPDRFGRNSDSGADGRTVGGTGVGAELVANEPIAG